MIDFFKFMLECLAYVLDCYVGNAVKTPVETKMAGIGLLCLFVGGLIYFAFSSKICPDSWRHMKITVVSVLAGICATVICFAIVYAVIHIFAIEFFV